MYKINKLQVHIVQHSKYNQYFSNYGKYNCDYSNFKSNITFHCCESCFTSENYIHQLYIKIPSRMHTKYSLNKQT